MNAPVVDVTPCCYLATVLALEIFEDYLSWLRVNVPYAFENLAPPATSAELNALEQHLGHELPADVKAVLGTHNGQLSTDTSFRIAYATPCIPTLSFLSTDLIRECWDQWSDLRSESDFEDFQDIGDVFPGAAGLVKPMYSSPGWIPLWADPIRADYIGVDLDPDSAGTAGQIINFGRDEERHFVCAPDFASLLQILLEEVRSGAWPASKIATQYADRTWADLPWFGAPKDHFFNALYKRFAAHTQS